MSDKHIIISKKLFVLLLIFLISCSTSKLEVQDWCEDVFIPNNKYYQINVNNQKGFEIPPVLKASEFLPKKLLESKIYKISENVYSDGIIDHFEVNSKWGKVRASGFLVLKSKLNQINAIDSLEKIEKEETPFIAGAWNAIKNVAMSPVNFGKLVYNFFAGDSSSKKEIEYSQDEKSRIEHYYNKQKEYAMNNNDEDEEEVEVTNKRFVKIQDTDKNYVTHVPYENEEIEDLSVIEDLMGVKKYAMEIMEQFNIDPDHTNQVLKDKILNIARQKAAGGLTTVLIPSSEVLTVLSGTNTVTGTANSISDYRNINSHIELIHDGLLLAGCSEKLIKRFKESKGFSNFLKSIIAMNVVRLRYIKNINELIKIATLIDDYETGWIFMNVAALLPTVAKEETIVRLIKDAPLIAAVTQDNRVIILFAGDHLYWTKGNDLLYRETLEAIKEDGINAKSIETRIRGIITPRFKEELRKLGIKLKYVDNVEYSIKIYNE